MTPFAALARRPFVERGFVALGLFTAFLSLGANVGVTAFRYSGDAVIHLTFSERLAAGHPFEFNAGIPSSGTTSFAWNVYEAAWMRAVGPSHALVGIATSCLVTLVAGAWLVAWTAVRLGATRRTALAAALCFAAMPGTAHNAPLGMETAPFALVCLGAVAFTAFAVSRTLPTLGLYAVMAALTASLRPEGALTMAILVLASLGRRDFRLAAAGVCGSLVVVPIAMLHHRTTGAWLPGSALARVAAARRDEWTLHVFGPLFVYGRPLLRVILCWPIVGAAALVGKTGTLDENAPRRRFGWLSGALVAVAVMLYGLVTGAAHTARYFVWVWALAIPLAAVTLEHGWSLGGRWRRAVFIAIGWLSAMAIVETVERFRDHGLRVGYGVGELQDALASRDLATRQLLEKLGARRPQGKVRVAMQEVQSRWYMSDDVDVLSLDGRTAPAANPVRFDARGCPDLTAVLVQANLISEWPEDKMPSCNFGPAWDALYSKGHGEETVVPP